MNKRILIPRPSIDHHEDAFKIVEEEDEDDLSEDLPSFKSVILKPTNAQTEQNLFYDQQQSKWIELDNFAFNDNLNHFDEKSTSCEETSSLALLDSRIFDESKCEEDSKIIVNELKKHLDDANRNTNESFTTEDSSQPNSLDVSFDTAAKPKIKSPKDKQTVAKSRKKSSPLRKLSNESQKLPSRPETSSTPEVSSAEKSKQFKRNRSKSHNEQYHAAPVVQRKLNLDKTAKKLGQNRSHSATNLNKLSVKDYHGSFQLQSRRSSNGAEPNKSSSCDSLYQVSLKELAGKKADYSHVQSKVRQYIYGDQKSASTIQQNDLHGKSFVLSPGRKSLSMSNLVQEIDTTNCSRRTSIKSFLSSKNLDDLQVQIRRSRSSTMLSKSRESLLLVSNDKVSRLLDHHSSEDEILQAAATDEFQNPDLLFEVQELLEVAMNERQSKMEAKQVLAQLQTNYDELQKKFAAAEITIDKLRFGSSDTNNTNGDGTVMMLESTLNEENQCFYPSETFSSCQIACQNLSTSLTSSNTSLSNFYHMLTEIKEQLYGFEILSSNVSSYTSLERKATMEKLKISYTSIQNNCRIGINDATFMKLLNEVGEKLYIMDLQSKDDTDYETFAQGITKKEVIIDEIDPLEKVAKWRKDLNKPSNVPSGYGSNSTSPTPIVGCKKIVSSERSSFEERSPGDLDSGCPGSERSPSALISNVSAMTRNLSHVEETEEPQNSQSSVVKYPDVMTKKKSTLTAPAFHPSADFSSDEQHLSTKKHNKRSQQHYFEPFSKEKKNVEMRQLHSITDLSSDEEVVFDNNNTTIQSAAAPQPQISASSSAMNYQQKVENEIDRLREQLEITTNNTPKKSNDSASHNSTLNMDLPNVDLNMTPRGSHVILAQQIDQEISELRNIFEDHKEEMLSVINEDRAAISTANVGCSPIIFDNPKMRSYPNSSSPRRTRIKKSIPNFSDSEDSRDVQEERRQEFERFRQMRKQKRNSTTQNQPVPPPQFAIGQPISSANISSLFPKVEDPSSGGRHVPTADGDQVFIPRLNLDDQWSIEDPQHQQQKSLELKVDKSCQTVELLKNFKIFDKKKGKYKSKDLAHLIETLKTANDIASRMKQRSEDLLNELQSEIDTITMFKRNTE